MKKHPMDGEAQVEEMLSNDQLGLFAAIGELDWYSGSHRQWIDDLELRVDHRVLEVGCATGALTSYVAGSGCRITGLDSSADMITRARTDHAHLEFVVGDATSLDYGDDTFTAVIAASVINVVDDADLVLSEMHRVCAPGGAVSVLVPAAGFSDVDHRALSSSLELSGFSEAALAKWHRGPQKMSGPQLEALFDDVGFAQIRTRSYLDGMLISVTAAA